MKLTLAHTDGSAPVWLQAVDVVVDVTSAVVDMGPGECGLRLAQPDGVAVAMTWITCTCSACESSLR